MHTQTDIIHKMIYACDCGHSSRVTLYPGLTLTFTQMLQFSTLCDSGKHREYTVFFPSYTMICTYANMHFEYNRSS